MHDFGFSRSRKTKVIEVMRNARIQKMGQRYTRAIWAILRPVRQARRRCGCGAFEHLKNEAIYDIDEPGCLRPWRKWVVAARQETEGEDIPPVNCKDIDQWKSEVEELADRILWDSDYEDGDMYLDHPPEISKKLIDWMEIDDDYFTAIVEDLTDEQARATIKELQKLCDSIIKSF